MQGFNTHRHDQNPKEKELHDKFISEIVDSPYTPNCIDTVVFGNSSYRTPNDYLSDREKEIAISLIQWIGSPVGQGFMRSCGFKLVKEND